VRDDRGGDRSVVHPLIVQVNHQRDGRRELDAELGPR
jgi:hypothetical protein